MMTAGRLTGTGFGAAAEEEGAAVPTLFELASLQPSGAERAAADTTEAVPAARRRIRCQPGVELVADVLTRRRAR